MATPQVISYPDINGHRYSFASIEATFNGLLFAGFTEISYGNSLAPGDVYGTSSNKLGRTKGKQDSKCSFTMYKSEFENLRLTLGAAGVAYGETPFNITVTYFELGQVPITDLIEGIRIVEDEDMPGSSDSAEPSKVKVTCNVMRVYRALTDSIANPVPIP